MPSTVEHVPAVIDVHPAHAPKPTLRGWSHVVAAITLATLGTVILRTSDATSGDRTWLSLYLLGTLAMFGVSALYHRGRWQPVAHRRMQRLDHSTIFLAIAGTYTPIAATHLDGWAKPAVLGTVWGGAAAGVALQWLPVHVPRWLSTAVYVVVGWSMALALPQLFRGMGALGFSLVLGGGLAYTGGAVVYGLKRPDPWPRVFGFHEVFHLCTVTGAGLHLAAVAFVVLPEL
jgi:hemolysin III